MQELLATSANGIKVYYDSESSHAATYFADAPGIKELAQEITAKTKLHDELMFFDTDMGRIVGNTDEVMNEPGDQIVFAMRRNRNVYTSFNKSKTPRPCSVVTTVFKKQADGTYELTSAWIGTANSPSFPGELDETPESKPYWLAHSLAWGSQEIQPGTETSICPW